MVPQPRAFIFSFRIFLLLTICVALITYAKKFAAKVWAFYLLNSENCLSAEC